MAQLHALIDDLAALDKRLRRFEKKYGVLSDEFYRAFVNGDLAEFDANDEYRLEFIEWAALCQTRQKLVTAYQQRAHSIADVAPFWTRKEPVGYNWEERG